MKLFIACCEPSPYIAAMTRKLIASLFGSTALALGIPAAAQDAPVAEAPGPSATSHGIVAVVNDDIVSTHDLRQRVLFLLATTGAARDEQSIARLQQQALRNLVDERLQMQEAQKYDQTISDRQIDRRVVQLISRNNLSPEEVQARLAEVGVSLQTLREQVRSEIAWQRIVNGLFGSRIRISDAQIDETLSRLSANADEPSYRVAEIFIEATPDIGGQDGAMEGAQAMITQINEGAPFPLLARQFSSAPSAAKGGDVGYVREGELRPELDAVLSTLSPGDISEPITVPGGVYVIALLEKRVEESDTIFRLKQVNHPIAEGDDIEALAARFAEVRASVDDCDTLEEDVEVFDGFTVADAGQVKASEMQDEVLGRVQDVQVGGLSEPIRTPASLVALFVCEREVTGKSIPTRDDIEERLIDQQLAQASRRHLRDLRRQAAIVTR